MRKIHLFLCAFLLGAPHAALAASVIPETNEMVYRVNLGRADDVKLLLEQGTPANQKDDKGTPLLALAASRLDEEGLKVMQVLVDAGADVNLKDGNGQSPLFYAARKGNEPAVQFLLDNKVNYYSVDSNGDIARTIAFRAGYNNIVKIMDSFVRGETEKVTAQYRELSRVLEEQYKAHEESQKKIADEATQAALERSRQITEEEQARARNAEMNEQELEKKRASDAFVQARYELSFHACSYQYWSLCKDLKQTSELAPDVLDQAIAEHTKKISERNADLLHTYKVSQKSITGIITNAQQSIFNELMGMPSKTYRFEHGVCKMKDLVERCDKIAKYPGELVVKGNENSKAAKGKSTAKGRGYQRIKKK